MAQAFISHTTPLHQRRTVWLGLALAIVLDTITQICWKFAVGRVTETIGL